MMQIQSIMSVKHISLVMLLLGAVSVFAHTFTEASLYTTVDTRDSAWVPFVSEGYTEVSALTELDTRNPAFRPFSSGAYIGTSGLTPVDSRDYTLTVVSEYGNPVPATGVYSNYCWHSAVTCSVEAVLIDGGMEYVVTGWGGNGIAPASGTTNVTGQLLLTDPDAIFNWNWLVEQWDADLDMLPDRWEQSIVDADPDDDITSLADVLPDGDADGDGIQNVFEYAFEENLSTNEPLLTIQIVDGRPVLQVPEQSTQSTRYIEIEVECSGDLQSWNIPVVPVATSNQPPAGKAWYESMNAPTNAFFIIHAAGQ
ncbi:hypothetical protein [Pontiella agarivorans]|uniref:Uncharacterized protein n=1 Tax=Pontiella agarivorans TaxID=3038953 RepID=A0ABU5MXE4_9BACT|nr:hypothetical protein [Pontiella agarivorans]MDZ8118883.1 hypothetical protein [Pontiella agarivorans]